MASRAQLDLEVQMKGADKASADMKDMSKQASVLDKAMGGLKGGMGALGGALTVAGGAAGIFAGAMLGAAKAAADEQVGIDRLNTTLKNNGFGAAAGDVDKYVTAKQKLAFGDDELRDSLNLLVTQTGDLTAAQGLQTTAMDLARFGNIDLEKATRLLLKADDESYAALGKLGIQLDATKTKEENLGTIREKVAGQSETFANSASGSMIRAQNAIGNAVETIGGKILGMLEGPLAGITTWLESPEFQSFVDGAATALAGAFDAIKVAGQFLYDNVIKPLWDYFSQADVQTTLSNIAGVIGGALVTGFNALKTAGGWVWDNLLKPLFEWLQKPEIKSAIEGIATAIGSVLGGAWTVLETAAKFVWNNILKPFFEWLGTPEVSNTIGTIAGAISGALAGAWTALEGAAKWVWENVLVPFWDFIQGAAKFIGDVAGAISGGLVSAWDGLTKAAKEAWKIIQDVWNFLTGQAATDATKAGESAVGNFGTGMSTGMTKVAAQAKILAALTGEQISAGVKEGIERTKDIPFVGMTAALLFLESETAKKLESQSPSQVYARIGETIPAGLGQGITDNKDDADTAMTGVTTSILGLAQTAFTVANYSPFGMAVAAGIAGGITSGTGADMLAAGAAAGAGGGAVGAAANLASGVKGAIDSVITFAYFKGAGDAVSGGITAGITAFHAAAVTAATSLATGIQGAIAAVITWGKFNDYGLAVGNGLRDGINTSAPGAIAAARNMVNAINNEIAKKLDIGSPSKVAMRFGEMYGAGFALGVANATPMVSRATAGMVAGAAVSSMPVNFNGGITIVQQPGQNGGHLANEFIDTLRIRLKSAELLSTGGARVYG